MSSSSSDSTASPAAVATGFPDSVPAWYTGPSGASSSITSARPPSAASGKPPPTTLPNIERSGVMPYMPCAPASPSRNPVITSSNTRSAPTRGAAVAQAFEEAVARRHQAHVRGDRFDDHRGEIGAEARERVVERGVVVVTARRSCRRRFPR